MSLFESDMLLRANLFLLKGDMWFFRSQASRRPGLLMGGDSQTLHEVTLLLTKRYGCTVESRKTQEPALSGSWSGNVH